MQFRLAHIVLNILDEKMQATKAFVDVSRNYRIVSNQLRYSYEHNQIILHHGLLMSNYERISPLPSKNYNLLANEMQFDFALLGCHLWPFGLQLV